MPADGLKQDLQTGTIDLVGATTYRCPYPDCGAVSHNPNDLREGYCGRCHRWAADSA